MRIAVIFPGRGSYGPSSLGSLDPDHPSIAVLEAIRRERGAPGLLELDRADRFRPGVHLAGENASLLTFAASVQDLDAIDRDRHRIVAVAGNSLGWYTALHASGALSLEAAGRLVDGMGALQAGRDLGGQVLYPLVDGDWRPDPACEQAVEAALEDPEVHLSIRLGGTAVLGATDAACRRLLAELPEVVRSGRRFPLRLPLHAAFHTPLMAPVAEEALQLFGDLPFRAPRLPLVDGRGATWRRWSPAGDLLHATLWTQVVRTYDFTATVRVVLGEFAPDAIVLPGPGDTLGGPVGQVMAQVGWRGIRSLEDFLAVQRSEEPAVLSMTRPDQRARVAR